MMPKVFLQRIRRFLGLRLWGGVGALAACVMVLYQCEVMLERIETISPAPEEEEPVPNEAVGRPAGPIQFSVVKRVRCPGGGDWLGRERNKRSAKLSFRAPPGRWIEAATVEVIERHHGYSRDVRYDELDVEGTRRRVGAHVTIGCNPPDYPGAPGGWMEVRLKSAAP